MRSVCGYSHSSMPVIVDVVSFMKLLQMHTHSSRGTKKKEIKKENNTVFWVIAAAKYLLKLVNLHASCIFLKVKKSHFILK